MTMLKLLILLELVLLLPFYGECRGFPYPQRLYSTSESSGPVVDTVNGKVRYSAVGN